MDEKSPTLPQALLGALIRALAFLSDILYGSEGLNLILKIAPMHTVPTILRSRGAVIGDNVRFRSPLTIHNADLCRRRITAT